MNYCVVKDGLVVNMIVCADDETAALFDALPSYEGAEIGLPYEPPEPEEPEAEPTVEERVAALEEALAQTDEAAIALYEAQAEQEEINAAQDEALIELYEMMEG